MMLVIMGTAIDGSAQSPRQSQQRIIVERQERIIVEREKILAIMETQLQEYPQFSDKFLMYEHQVLLEKLQGLRDGQRPEFTEKYLLNKGGNREYCAADYFSAPPSQRPYRWCDYHDMASCLEATRDHSHYSCELNQFYRGR